MLCSRVKVSYWLDLFVLTEMVKNDWGFIGEEVCDAYRESVRGQHQQIDSRLFNYEKWKKDNKICDPHYKNILCNLTKEEWFVPHNTKEVKDSELVEVEIKECENKGCDLDYKKMLRNLTKEERFEPHKTREVNDSKLVETKDCDTYQDLITGGLRKIDNRLLEFEKCIEDIDEWDPDYKDWFCNLTKEARSQLCHKRKVEDDDVSGYISDSDDEYNSDEDIDPQYELALKSLREYGKSYVLDENDGLRVFAYEEDTGLDSECEPEPEPRRKLRSFTKKELGEQNMSDKKIETRTHRKSIDQPKINKVNNVKQEIDPDYRNFLQACEFVNDDIIYKYGNHTIVYGKTDVEKDIKKEKHDEDTGSYSDVEIIDSATFCEEGNANPFKMSNGSSQKLGGSNMEAEFRQQVMTVLRKPFDEEEYVRLWKDVKISNPKCHHKELRNGRAASFATEIEGKSYLDHYPDLNRHLSEFPDDYPKRLNLLRGFFFWLQNIQHDGSFKPWQDKECLSTDPASF